MACIGRFVVPDLPHHVTQRGNRCEKVFFGDDDYALYRDLLHEACRREGVAVWAYCLMPNHVHLILTPQTPEALGRALGKAHRRYSAFVNARMRVTGHLFQARFSSVVVDEGHLMAGATRGRAQEARRSAGRRGGRARRSKEIIQICIPHRFPLLSFIPI